MNNPESFVGRRHFLRNGLLAASGFAFGPKLWCQQPGNAAAAQRLESHDNGINPPRALPNVPVLCANGKTTALHDLLLGRATALTFMFTSCMTVCPIQGAVFRRVQELLPEGNAHAVQLLSLSVDPEADSAQTLREWLGRFDARPGWTAAAPRAGDLPALRGFFGDSKGVASHATRVYLVNRRAEWIWQTYDLPSAESIAAMLRKLEV